MTTQQPPTALTQQALRHQALQLFARLGVNGQEVYFVELIPLAVMAWADGELQQPERRVLEAVVEDHVHWLNEQVGAPVFHVSTGRRVLERFLGRRLTSGERGLLLEGLRRWFASASTGPLVGQRVLEWATQVAGVAALDEGSDAYDTRELFWLNALEKVVPSEVLPDSSRPPRRSAPHA